MKTAGVIAEYNPFHKGHEYQLRRIKETLKADYVIVAMSGDFVQRGAPAFFDKRLRAEMALRCGADLVLELPVSVSTASAEFFAKGGVGLLDALGVTDVLCFGSETGETDPLLKLAEILNSEPPQYRQLLRQELCAGASFPTARSRALTAFLEQNEDGSEPSLRQISRLLSQPNNILGAEYCKALLACKSSIRPVAIKREGAGYHDAGLPSESFASASAIRREIQRLFRASRDVEASDGFSLLPEDLTAQIPPNARELFADALLRGAWVTEKDFDSILHYRLMTTPREELSAYPDMSDALADRMINRLSEYQSFSSFCSLLKTKELTYARIQRALLHVLLGIRQIPEEISYARALGFRRSSVPLLSEIKKKSSIPLLTRPKDAACRIPSLEETVFASNLYEGILSRKTGRSFVHEYQKPLVITD